jgi:hypothetical protein
MYRLQSSTPPPVALQYNHIKEALPIFLEGHNQGKLWKSNLYDCCTQLKNSICATYVSRYEALQWDPLVSLLDHIRPEIGYYNSAPWNSTFFYGPFAQFIFALGEWLNHHSCDAGFLAEQLQALTCLPPLSVRGDDNLWTPSHDVVLPSQNAAIFPAFPWRSEAALFMLDPNLPERQAYENTRVVYYGNQRLPYYANMRIVHYAMEVLPQYLKIDFFDDSSDMRLYASYNGRCKHVPLSNSQNVLLQDVFPPGSQLAFKRLNNRRILKRSFGMQHSFEKEYGPLCLPSCFRASSIDDIRRCALCSEEISVETTFFRPLTCAHAFHLHCVQDALYQQRLKALADARCPACEKDKT